MKQLLIIAGFLVASVTGFAQDKQESNKETSVKIELTEASAEKAKSLKGLENGKLSKGLNRTTFLVSTSDAKALKKELKAMFPDSKVSIVKD